MIGSELVVAVGRTATDLLDPAETLGDADGYRSAAQALGDGFEASTYLDLPALFSVAEAGSGAEPSFDGATAYLDGLSYAIAGSRFEDGLAISRVVLGVSGG